MTTNFTPEITQEISLAIDLISEPGSEPRGLTMLEDMAQQGDPNAIHYLSLYLSDIEEREDDAKYWLEKAVSFGSPDAAWNLAMIARSHGITDESRRWIDIAADLGEPDAIEARSKDYDVESVLTKYQSE
ncbi:sel1 repeat family protein [Sphingomonas sp. Root710]|uniref:sel1 repeat family protein n=1 Tax=Sphingomonas sp. Root710 TaxID=1736594 RepID=UPI0012E3C923|nr:sel1 repeat family protein [Sphingomonas sp. Root710]